MNPNQVLSVLVRDWMKRQKLCTRAAAKRLGMAEMSLWRRSTVIASGVQTSCCACAMKGSTSRASFSTLSSTKRRSQHERAEEHRRVDGRCAL